MRGKDALDRKVSRLYRARRLALFRQTPADELGLLFWFGELLFRLEADERRRG